MIHVVRDITSLILGMRTLNTGSHSRSVVQEGLVFGTGWRAVRRASTLAAVMLMMILLHQLRQPGTTVEFFYLLHDLVSAPLGDEHDPNVVVEPAS